MYRAVLSVFECFNDLDVCTFDYACVVKVEPYTSLLPMVWSICAMSIRNPNTRPLPIMVSLMPSTVITQIIECFYTDIPQELQAHAAKYTQLQTLFNYINKDLGDLYDAINRLVPIMDAMHLDDDLSYAHVVAASESFQKHYAQSANRHMHDTNSLLQCLRPLLSPPLQASRSAKPFIHTLYSYIRVNYRDLEGLVNVKASRSIEVEIQLHSLDLRLRDLMFAACSIRRLCTTTRMATAQVWEHYHTLFGDSLPLPPSYQ